MAKRRRKKKIGRMHRAVRWILLVLLAPVALYLLAALVGALIPVNAAWEEPEEGVTVYLVDNGVHLDIAFPAAAGGLDWRDDFPGEDFADPRWANASWVMIGSGDMGVYTTAQDWGDLTLFVALNSMIDGDRVMHVQFIPPPADFAAAEIRLRPAEYRRLFQAVRSSFELDGEGRPDRLAIDGYYPSDAFYEANGSFNVFVTCNQWVASRLRIAGVESSLWTPFSKGLPWRYRDPGGVVLKARSD